jgi:hypothetical protein
MEQLKAAHVPSGLRSLLQSMLALERGARPGTHDLAARLQRCAAQTSEKFVQSLSCRSPISARNATRNTSVMVLQKKFQRSVRSAVSTFRREHPASRFAEPPDAREIGKHLGVETLLDGSIRKAGKRVRISVQLVDASNGYQLWSERFDREIEDG